VTVLHWALLGAGLVTFHGPALLPELGEHPAVLADTDAWLRAAWFETICRHLKGSPAWPDLSGALLFLETSEEVRRPSRSTATWPSSPTPPSSTRSPACWSAAPTATTRSRRDACGR
jgi:muramoyltetrapeptide carboxypeptidase LdcA involved in peptidoglycan recycling